MVLYLNGTSEVNHSGSWPAHQGLTHTHTDTHVPETSISDPGVMHLQAPRSLFSEGQKTREAPGHVTVPSS